MMDPPRKPSNRIVWLSLLLSLVLLPLVVWAAGSFAERTGAPVLLALLGASILAASLTRPVFHGRQSEGMLILGARSLRMTARALGFAFSWMIVVAVLIVGALVVRTAALTAVFLLLVVHAIVATVVHIAIASVPRQPLRHRRGAIVVRMPNGGRPDQQGWLRLVEALETARNGRADRLLMSILDRQGSPVISIDPDSCVGPFDLEVKQDDWLAPILGFRVFHLHTDIAGGASRTGEVPLDALCDAVRAGTPGDLMRLEASRTTARAHARQQEPT